MSSITLPDYVLIHPGLSVDPVNKQGEIGVIVASQPQSDEFYVGFDDNQVGFYAADALLMINDIAMLYQYMDEHHNSMSESDLKAMINVTLLQKYGSSQHQKQALKVVLHHPKILDKAMVTLASVLTEARSSKIGR
ncbi:MAG TPA: hypothetical protein VGM63_24585 [Mucilaginibacter sp.]|jgi:hypothetical protein